jgi:murein DD-endopeptidase MepM/ murein hydrolase activator NlpD
MLGACSYTGALLKRAEKPFPVAEAKAASPKITPEPKSGDQEGAFHIVGAGEGLTHICSVYGLDLKKVAEINELKPPYSLKVGDAIFLPADALLSVGEEFTDSLKASDAKTKSRTAREKQSIQNVAMAMRGKKHPLVPRLKFPVSDGELTSPFGYRWGVFHKGLDIAAPIGRQVVACADGRVIFAGTSDELPRYGKMMVVEHGRGVYTHYAHLNQFYVKTGQRIKAGQKIAAVGNTGRSTGPHLHLELRVLNQMFNPLAYFSQTELTGMRVTSRFANSPMGPVAARWKIPEIVSARR